MPIDNVSQVLIVLIPSIIALFLSYAFFENSFNYFLWFELIFLTLFVGLNIIDYYYLAVVILVLAILLYQAIEPNLRKGYRGSGE